MKKLIIFFTILVAFFVMFIFIGYTLGVEHVLNEQKITCQTEKTSDNFRMCQVKFNNQKAFYATIDKN